MSILQFVKAKPKMMFVLTEYGFEQKAPREMFRNKNGTSKAPVDWIHKGYVVEVPIEKED